MAKQSKNVNKEFVISLPHPSYVTSTTGNLPDEYFGVPLIAVRMATTPSGATRRYLGGMITSCEVARRTAIKRVRDSVGLENCAYAFEEVYAEDGKPLSEEDFYWAQVGHLAEKLSEKRKDITDPEGHAKKLVNLLFVDRAK